MPSDPRSRPTVPPIRREEDSPPGVFREIPAHTIKGEPIARVALKAPLVKAVTEESQHEELMRALASVEGRTLSKISDLDDARQIFEDKMRQEIRALVVKEIRTSLPPVDIKSKKKGFDWSSLQYVAGLIVALTGLIALIVNAGKPSAEVAKRFDAIDQAQQKLDKKLEAHVAAEAAERTKDRNEDYRYKIDVRSWVTDVLERAASVKIDDPPGTPAREQLRFYPPPLVDPHKVTSAHIVQPQDPYPVPPPP